VVYDSFRCRLLQAVAFFIFREYIPGKKESFLIVIM
jgi:hypothetical protein